MLKKINILIDILIDILINVLIQILIDILIQILIDIDVNGYINWDEIIIDRDINILIKNVIKEIYINGKRNKEVNIEIII